MYLILQSIKNMQIKIKKSISRPHSHQKKKGKKGRMRNVDVEPKEFSQAAARKIN